MLSSSHLGTQRLPSHLEYAFLEVLGQRKTKHFQPIHYASKTMTEAQAHYTTTIRITCRRCHAFEKFPAISCLSKSRVYTTIPLSSTCLLSKKLSQELLRWNFAAPEFDVVIVIKRSRKSRADHLSRLETPLKVRSRKGMSGGSSKRVTQISLFLRVARRGASDAVRFMKRVMIKTLDYIVSWPEVKGGWMKSPDNYPLKELHCSTQCHTQMSMWIISRGVCNFLNFLRVKGLSSPCDTKIAKRIEVDLDYTKVVLDSCFHRIYGSKNLLKDRRMCGLGEDRSVNFAKKESKKKGWSTKSFKTRRTQKTTSAVEALWRR
ncbi:hypothetical protein Tco_0634604 [Tanacetum coccineum]